MRPAGRLVNSSRQLDVRELRGVKLMRVPGMPPAMKPEELYRRLGRIIEAAPPPPEPALSTEFMKWVGQASALINAIGDLALSAEAQLATNGLHYPDRKLKFEKLMLLLHKALAIAELDAPPGAQGAFIPVGNTLDAYVALAKILGSAKIDVLIVDPYMDDTVITEFAASVPEGIPLRLLTDEATAKPNLAPAAMKWNQQYPTRRLGVRLASPRALHDRAIFIDKTQAWTVTQSLKDLAKRSPAEIVRGDDTAALKVSAYEAVWTTATVIV
jgi:hypothetical protein